MNKKHFYILLPLIFLLSFGLFVFYAPVISNPEGMNYHLKPGTSKKAFISDLSQQGIVRYPALFTFYVNSQPDSVLKAGEYLFPKGSSLSSIWQQVTEGRGLAYFTYTIIPGWTFSQMRKVLGDAPEMQHDTAQMSDQQIMQQLGQANLLPEGNFFPDTYYYNRKSSDIVVLKRAFILMQTKLKEAWEKRAPHLPYQTPYEALIAASLIEKEAHEEIERPIISGVLVNRLRKGMLLQFDPTVIYGLNDRYTGKISKQNLQEDTPYNTYVHKGLPPTPIAMPSMASIQAALHPEQHDFYYFVAKGDGTHQFSKNLADHNKAVAISIAHPLPYFNEILIKKYLQQTLTKNLT